MDTGSSSSGCTFWTTCLWHSLLQTFGYESAVSPEQNMKNQWAVIQGASSEYTYRERIGPEAVDELHNTHETQVLDALQRIAHVGFFNINGMTSHLDAHKYMVHLYAVPIQEGCVAKYPGSEFLKKFTLRVRFGTKQKFREFVNDELKISLDELETRLRNAGFEIKK